MADQIKSRFTIRRGLKSEERINGEKFEQSSSVNTKRPIHHNHVRVTPHLRSYLLQCFILTIALPYCCFLFFHAHYEQRNIYSTSDQSLEREISNQDASKHNEFLSGQISKPSQNYPNIRTGKGQRKIKQKDKYPLTFSQPFLRHLKLLPPLPKIVHIFFPDKDYWKNAKHLGFVQNSILNVMKLNPDWKIYVYNDEDIGNVIRRAADKKLISRAECDLLVGRKISRGSNEIPVQSAHIAERSDIARLLLMYMEGGFYIDSDHLISKKMSDVVSPYTKFCLPTHGDIYFAQDIMCSSPGNKIILSAIHGATTRRMRGGLDGTPLPRRGGWLEGGSLFELGPQSFNMEVLNMLFLGITKRDYFKYDGNTEFFKAAREKIGELNGLVATGLDDSCTEGFLVNASIGRCYNRNELYEMYGMKSWSEEIDARWASK